MTIEVTGEHTDQQSMLIDLIEAVYGDDLIARICHRQAIDNRAFAKSTAISGGMVFTVRLLSKGSQVDAKALGHGEFPSSVRVKLADQINSRNLYLYDFLDQLPEAIEQLDQQNHLLKLIDEGPERNLPARARLPLMLSSPIALIIQCIVIVFFWGLALYTF